MKSKCCKRSNIRCNRSKCKKCCKAFNERLSDLDDLIDSIVSPRTDPELPPISPSAFSISRSCGKQHIKTAGVLNYDSNVPFTENSIIRIASMSKFLGTVGFLQLVEKGLVSIFDPLSKYIPEFANTEVLEKFTPTATVNLNNVITATNGSNVLNINEAGHGRSNDDTIGIEDVVDVQGIPESEINAVHTITVVNANNYTITVTTNATGTSGVGEGGAIKVQTLDTGVNRTQYFTDVRYYKTVPLVRPITIYHVLTHSLGYCYAIATVPLSFGFNEDPELVDIQAGIVKEKGLPQGIPNPDLPKSGDTIIQWSTDMASVPLLFQPGENWSYGPQLGILGALIEKVDLLGRDVDTYFKQEIFIPLEMNDTGFFIQDADPNFAAKVARFQTMYLEGTVIPITLVAPLAFFEDYNYKLGQPKTLFFVDAAFFSTPLDYSKFLDMLINNGKTLCGKTILSPAMIKYASENHILDKTVSNLYEYLPPTKFPKWGLGVGTTAGSTGYIALSGVSERNMWWNGFYGTVYSADIGNKKNVVAGMNILNVALDTENKILTANYAAFNYVDANNENISSNNEQVI